MKPLSLERLHSEGLPQLHISVSEAINCSPHNSDIDRVIISSEIHSGNFPHVIDFKKAFTWKIAPLSVKIGLKQASICITLVKVMLLIFKTKKIIHPHYKSDE